MDVITAVRAHDRPSEWYVVFKECEERKWGMGRVPSRAGPSHAQRDGHVIRRLTMFESDLL